MVSGERKDFCDKKIGLYIYTCTSVSHINNFLTIRIRRAGLRGHHEVVGEADGHESQEDEEDAEPAN
jgi:hypothetical protein